jgi:hypothetical protein
MFSIIGYQDYTKVYTMFWRFSKAKGVTTLGSVGHGIEPSSRETPRTRPTRPNPPAFADPSYRA